MNDVKEYDKARLVTEPELERLINREGVFAGHKVKSTRHSTNQEDKDHIDIFVDTDGGKYQIDAKQAKEENAGRGTYCISEHMAQDMVNNTKKYDNHFLAFVQYGPDRQPTGKYILLESKNVAQRLSDIENG